MLIQFSGPYQAEATAIITRKLAELDARILDIGQTVMHGTLALVLLVEDSDSGALQPTISALAAELGLDCRFSQPGAHPGSSSQPPAACLITLLGNQITAHHLSRVLAIVAAHGLDVNRIHRPSARLALADSSPYACVEIKAIWRLSLTGQGPGADPLEDALRAQLLDAANELGIDIALQRDSIYRRNRRLFAFDMDSTIIAGEEIDELAKLAGVGDQVAAITASAMRGDFEFQESFRRRMALLKGLPEEQVYSLLDRIPLTDGAERLLRTLKALGYKTAILSGGFTFYARHLQRRLQIDYIHANEIEIASGKVTGRVTGPIVDGPRKAALLQQIAAQEQISLEQVVAVGDGANDLPMLKLAGMGIAFRAKLVVRANADFALSQLGLDSLLYLIGVQDSDLRTLKIPGPTTSQLTRI
jgi:phosphoserine phosphatase